jgi:putative copper export protein
MTTWDTLSVLVHIVALGLWLGGIAFFLVVFGPAVHQLEPAIAINVLNKGRITFEAISWTAIILLLLTGTINLLLQSQMTGAKFGRYYLTILAVKLVLFVAMLAHHALQVFKYAPKIALFSAQANGSATGWPEPLRACWRKWFTLLKINATLAPIVTLLGLALVRS